MARGINKVILIGNLGQDPEVRFTPSGTAVANLSLATSESWMDKNSGTRQEKTEWHRIVLFNKTAEIAQQYLKKGAKVYVEGRLQTRKWQDQSGQDKYSTEIVCNDMQMLGGDGGGQSQQQQGGYQQPQQPPQPQQQPQPQPQQPQGYQQQGGHPPQPQQQQGGYQQAPSQPQQPQMPQPPQQQMPPQQAQAQQQSHDDFDDQIPF